VEAQQQRSRRVWGGCSCIHLASRDSPKPQRFGTVHVSALGRAALFKSPTPVPAGETGRAAEAGGSEIKAAVAPARASAGFGCNVLAASSCYRSVLVLVPLFGCLAVLCPPQRWRAAREQPSPPPFPSFWGGEGGGLGVDRGGDGGVSLRRLGTAPGKQSLGKGLLVEGMGVKRASRSWPHLIAPAVFLPRLLCAVCVGFFMRRGPRPMMLPPPFATFWSKLRRGHWPCRSTCNL
jgi:hypothetical protein